MSPQTQLTISRQQALTNLRGQLNRQESAKHEAYFNWRRTGKESYRREYLGHIALCDQFIAGIDDLTGGED